METPIRGLMNKKLTLTLSIMLLLVGCSITLKQQTLHLKRDWLEIRERAVVAYNQGKLNNIVVNEFVLSDEAFRLAYSNLVDKVLADGDVSEDEIRYLQNLIEAWKDKIP